MGSEGGGGGVVGEENGLLPSSSLPPPEAEMEVGREGGGTIEGRKEGMYSEIAFPSSSLGQRKSFVALLVQTVDSCPALG